MPLAFPRMFARGQKLAIADVYGELFIWPEGPFQYTIRVRSLDRRAGASVNASFVLYDAAQEPLGTYGMSPEAAVWCAPAGAGFTSNETESVLCGTVPRDKLEKAARVALVYRAKGQAADAAGAAGYASEGVELALSPVPET